MGRFCLDCDKRATCKAMCKALKKHLAHRCRAKNSVGAKHITSYGNMAALEDAIYDGRGTTRNS